MKYYCSNNAIYRNKRKIILLPEQYTFTNPE